MIYVAIIEDDVQLRRHLAGLLNGAEGFSCTADYTSCEQAIEDIPGNTPDIILMDIELPGMNGVEGTRRIKEKWPQIEILMLTIHEDNESVFQSLQNGACGYLVKNISPAELLKALKEAIDGGAPMSMQIARMVIRSFHKLQPDEPLTSREKEVLYKLRDGKSYKAIANELFIAKSTVKFHIKNIYRKLHVANKTQLALKSYRLNI